ncbi:hypothetical protein LCGC14_0610350 [marine sediment metagenome]|uniref:Uncharacterized protein n=1 Tax=marine sediment metagenome TaxID=412755 RepID=A0A0F9TU36_9ZZZZ
MAKATSAYLNRALRSLTQTGADVGCKVPPSSQGDGAMATMNAAQRLCAVTYGEGVCSHLKGVEAAENVGDTLFLFLIRELVEASENVGDTLFLFLIRELSDKYGAKMDWEAARQSLEGVIAECTEVLVNIKIEMEKTP